MGEPRAAVFVPGAAARMRLAGGMPKDPVDTVFMGRGDPIVTKMTLWRMSSIWVKIAIYVVTAGHRRASDRRFCARRGLTDTADGRDAA